MCERRGRHAEARVDPESGRAQLQRDQREVVDGVARDGAQLARERRGDEARVRRQVGLVAADRERSIRLARDVLEQRRAQHLDLLERV